MYKTRYSTSDRFDRKSLTMSKTINLESIEEFPYAQDDFVYEQESWPQSMTSILDEQFEEPPVSLEFIQWVDPSHNSHQHISNEPDLLIFPLSPSFSVTDEAPPTVFTQPLTADIVEIQLLSSNSHSSSDVLTVLSVSDSQQSSPIVQSRPIAIEHLHRRSRGRPSNVQIAARVSGGNQPTRRWLREMHNDSAMRSRAKFNAALDDLWKSIPQNKRMEALGEDISRQISRVEKIEIVISYVKSLQQTMSQSN